MKNMSVVTMVITAVVCAGCGASADGFESGEIDAEEPTGFEQMAIGESSCATATPDLSVIGDFTAIETPATYSNRNCSRAYVVGVSNVEAETGPEDYKYFQAQWKGSATTQAACTAATLQMDVYYSLIQWTAVSSQGTSGRWLSGTCIKPVLSMLPRLPGNYKVVVSGRTSSASSAPTVPVRLSILSW